MFTDLREFDKAKQYLTPGRGRGKDRGGGVVANESRELLSKQAEWARNSNDPQAAWYGLSGEPLGSNIDTSGDRVRCPYFRGLNPLFHVLGK